MDIYQIVNAQVRPWEFSVFISFFIILLILSIGLVVACIFDKIRLIQVFASIILYIYAFSVLSSTLFTRMIADYTGFEFRLFWSYFKIINEHDTKMLIEVLLNCVMLFPIGFLLPLSISKNLSWIWCFVISLIFSTSIEISQFIFKIGLFEFDDIFHNVLGSMLGFIVCKFIIRLFENNEEFDS